MNTSIVTYEFTTLPINDERLLSALEAFYGQNGVPYYDLVRGGVRFKQYVGVIQAGAYTIEVLPKIDKHDGEDYVWQAILVDMLRQSGMVKTDAPTSANLKLKSNSILELYFEMFISECEYILHRGLIKRYRKKEGNRNALKGSLVFSKHIRQNITHMERFYVNYTDYDVQHLINQILLKTIHLIAQCSKSIVLKSRIASLLINFPQLDPISVNSTTFDRLKFDRKSEHYQQAIRIAKLLLLNYHPNITKGKEGVLALMFDMNLLWEKWVLKQLQKHQTSTFKVIGQHALSFWKPTDQGAGKSLRPDIIIESNGDRIIIDTKWKLPKDERPSDEDLKQMFAYNNRFQSKHSILLYPGKKNSYSGSFYDTHGICELIFLDVLEKNRLNPKCVNAIIEKIEFILTQKSII
jgi:5-methylcytosine-specific restriction enzyme subunit McrC